ncbi:MAG: prolipoprotein diacylglyceryl transferase [Chloroflexi bacterium]|nr:prolipoprotein diacylglyceryl transferase [Chloroflexota bacterium]
MININIDPNIFHFGFFTLTWHGLFTAVAVIVGVWLAGRRIRGTSITEDQFYSVALWAIIGGIIGARLFHVVDQWAYYSRNLLTILAIQEGGLAIYGAIVGGVFASGVYAIWRRIPVWTFLDAGAPGLVLGQAIGRIGDVINGEHHGLATDLPWGFNYVHPNTLGERGVVAHPAVVYEMVWDIIVLGLLLAVGRRLKVKGSLFLLYAILYAIGRYFISFFRVDTLIGFGLVGLRQAQVIAVLVIVVTLPLLVYLNRPRKAITQD